MFSGYQEWEDYENELYQDESDSGLSDADSDLEFRLYSQLHYSAENQDGREDLKEVQSSTPQPRQKSLSPLPPAPVDVIVIDSGPDAITVSDNTEEDDSVCAKKGLTAKPWKRGPPYSAHSHGPSHLQTGRDSPDEIVVLDSESDESSDSESEESSDSHSLPPYVADLDSDSDSDGLENWMFLDRKKHEGDQNIKLNLSMEDNCEEQEYVNDGGKEQNWVVSEKDKEAQIYNKGVGPRRLSNRYYTEKSVTCHNCNKIGHLSKNCPTPKKVPCCSLCGIRGHLSRTCPNRHCSNCSLPGHDFNRCQERAYWYKRCHRCGMTGHFIDVCPEIWRQYHLTTKPGPVCQSSDPQARKTPAYCYNCSREGHFGYECRERRMYKGTYAALPYVTYYDKTQDIKCRDHRLKKKCRELLGDGLKVPDGGAVSFTPQPPRKKQKTNHKQSPHTPPTHANNPHTPKSRIAHTPKHHPQPHKQNTHLHFKQDPKTPRNGGKNTPHSAFTPQEQDLKKAKKKKKKKTKSPVIVIDEDEDFPRGCKNGPPTKAVLKSPWTANKKKPDTPGTGKNNNKKQENQTKKKQRKLKIKQKKAAKDAFKQPDNDNLFGIKQRRSR